MQIKETIGVSFPSFVESPSVEDVVALVDSACVVLGVQRAFSAKVRGVHDGDGGLVAFRYVEIPLVLSNGENSAALCHTTRLYDGRGAVAAGARARVRVIADVAQSGHDINNLLALIGGSLRLLECQSDAAYQKAAVDKMQEAIRRGALTRNPASNSASATTSASS